MTDDKNKKRVDEPDDQVETVEDTPVEKPSIETDTEDLSCPDGYPPDAWTAKSDSAKRAYITGIANSKLRTGAK